jgi:hypothetical protein
MSTTVTPKPGSQLWGIYYTDREIGDPLRTVIEAPTKLTAEEAAIRLSFGNPWAHPVSAKEAEQAHWLHKRRPRHRQELAHKHSRGVHV